MENLINLKERIWGLFTKKSNQTHMHLTFQKYNVKINNKLFSYIKLYTESQIPFKIIKERTN